jgi:tryptophanyl-tRNA synthetase
LQRELGANVSVDVSCEWLGFFMEDDDRLNQIYKDYGSGAMLTGEVKKELISILQVINCILVLIYFYSLVIKQEMIKDHQDRRAQVTSELLQEYMAVRPLEF